MAKKARKPARKATKAKRPAARKTPAKRGSSKKSTKQSVTIRLDTDVVSWFKKKADKYQTEINSVLRKHMGRG
jgi:uncharacterized protein (DUF4415 family)